MITVNLFDNTFRHDVGSVAGKPPTKIKYVRDQVDWDGITLFAGGCTSPEYVRRVRSDYKVGWLHEPRCYRPDAYENLDWDGLDLVLTHYEPFLGHPKAKLMPSCGVWLPRDRWGMRRKTKLCSMLYGAKNQTEGHQLRHAIGGSVQGIDYYGAGGTPVTYGWQAKEQVLADYAFSIVVETCREDNWFTEHLLDCFAVGTIPVLWGLPNYNEWFHPEGIIGFDTLGQLQAIVKNLSMGLYGRLRGAAQENLGRIGNYEIADDLVAEAIVKGENMKGETEGSQ